MISMLKSEKQVAVQKHCLQGIFAKTRKNLSGYISFRLIYRANIHGLIDLERKYSWFAFGCQDDSDRQKATWNFVIYTFVIDRKTCTLCCDRVTRQGQLDLKSNHQNLDLERPHMICIRANPSPARLITPRIGNYAIAHCKTGPWMGNDQMTNGSPWSINWSLSGPYLRRRVRTSAKILRARIDFRDNEMVWIFHPTLMFCVLNESLS